MTCIQTSHALAIFAFSLREYLLSLELGWREQIKANIYVLLFVRKSLTRTTLLPTRVSEIVPHCHLVDTRKLNDDIVKGIFLYLFADLGKFRVELQLEYKPALPAREDIYTHTRRTASPYSSGEGFDPIRSRMNEGPLGSHSLDDGRYLEAEMKNVIDIYL